MSDWRTRVDFTTSGLNAAAFPTRANWLQNISYIATTHVPKAGARTVMVTELHYDVQGISAIRTRRCFVVSSYADNNMPTLKPLLLAAFPGSSIVSGPTGGAMDLWNYPAGGPNIEFDWPLEVVRDTGVFAVLIDPPRYGYNSYTPANAYDGLIDAVCGIDAAKWFIGSLPLIWYPTVKPYNGSVRPVFELSPKLLLGGLSYGSMVASFMAGILPDADSVYLSGAYVVKATQAFSSPAYPSELYPSDWTASGFDYTDMLKASNIRRCMVSYGWDNGGVSGALPSDYARVNPSWTTTLIDNACNGLVSFNPARFEYRVKTTSPVIQGHEIDLPHIKAWMANRVAELI